ncbi:RNA 2',3'-cyclic phosphodiesterase [Sphingomonas koreensis]|uniref:RNA 2',3'-cyclic phosphodiesterase n=1 Tax=Sphingomonas koreensis TaxID=93064 RepID=A0A430G3H6_9SPHN|nr:RNA 2',3'-cyclic phosphodiesterase [Sphingomonas koreensis]RSY85441.1 RNA 2',3'-cyclic phosphodiesterase [Sphingomonas koreensis]
MHRLFVALRPSKAIRGRLLGAMGGVPGARWQDDAQLHLTLRYIGEVEPHAAEDVALVLGSVRHAPVELRLDGCGVFDDSRGRPNAIWAGVSPREPLAALHRKVDAAIVRAGLEPERRAYLPHITLARMSGSAGPVDRWLAEHAALASEPFAIDAMVLFESRLGHGGASYEPVARYPLTGS